MTSGLPDNALDAISTYANCDKQRKPKNCRPIDEMKNYRTIARKRLTRGENESPWSFEERIEEEALALKDEAHYIKQE